MWDWLRSGNEWSFAGVGRPWGERPSIYAHLRARRKSIMYEYTAWICATTGDLRSELAEEKVDEELRRTR